MVYFSDLLAVKYVNLILWLKVRVAFHHLHNLKIQSAMWMKNKFFIHILPLLQVDAFLQTVVSACIRPYDANDPIQNLTRMYHHTATESR